MNTIVHRSESRGLTSAGWLVGRHSFSFNRWYDPERVQFGALRVLNDDLIMPGEGFPPHSHENMEIVTIPLRGAVAHTDSSGGEGVVAAGEVQIMSAGTGVVHSEFNASKQEQLELLQIWILPERDGLPPRYNEQRFGPPEAGQWQLLVSPDQEAGSLGIFQQAWFSRTHVETEQELQYVRRGRDTGVYVFIISGAAQVAGEDLGRRDAVGITDAESFSVQTGQATDVLVIEVPMI